MRLVTYTKNRQARTGAILGSHIIDLAQTSAAMGKPPLPTDMLSLLTLGPRALATARATLRFAEANPAKATRHPLARTRLLAPVPNPHKLLALARNYASHVVEEGERLRAKSEQSPRVFMKPPSTTINHPGAPVTLSPYARWVDWEVELAIVIGRRATNVSIADAPRYIVGYTIVNDISERDFQVWPRTVTQEWDKFFDWLNGKWADGFAPMGPCITTADELSDPLDLRITLAVNGKTRQDANVNQLTFGPAELVAIISRTLTLEPGDVIATGTPSGIGHSSGLKLKSGDTMTAEIEGIGILENTVVRPNKKRKK